MPEDITYLSRTLADFLAKHGRKELVLPNFQRNFVWSRDDQQTIAASVLGGYPIGALLVLTGKANDFAARSLGSMASVKPARSCEFLLDGQQRLSALAYIFGDPLGFAGPAWKAAVDSTFPPLRHRWALRLTPESSEVDWAGTDLLRIPDSLPEPKEIKPFIVPLRINKTYKGTPPWYHPQWILDRVTGRGAKKESQRRQARSELANEAAEQGLIPLWEVLNATGEAQSLHQQVLKQYAARKEASLSSTHPTPSSWPKLLRTAIENASPNIAGKRAKKDFEEGEIDDAFRELATTWRTSVTAVVESAPQLALPYISLPSDRVARAIPIFEILNRGGTPLSTFDLVVARAARKGGRVGLADRLREHLQNWELDVTAPLWGNNAGPQPSKWSLGDRSIALRKGDLTPTFKTNFLSVLSLLVHGEGTFAQPSVAHTKEDAILDIDADDIESHWSASAECLLKAWAFLQFRCGVATEDALRNKLLILPVAAAVHTHPALTVEQANRIEYWYWTSTLSGRYAAQQNIRSIEDIAKLNAWLAGEQDPFVERRAEVLKFPGFSDEGTLLRTGEEAGSAPDVGSYLLQYVLSKTPRDFPSKHFTGAQPPRLSAWDEALTLEAHHIMPLASASTIQKSAQKIRRLGSTHVLNSPLNKTFISKEANRDIGSRSPAQYRSDVSDEAISQHYLPPREKWSVPGDPKEDATKAAYVDALRERFTLLYAEIADELDRLHS